MSLAAIQPSSTLMPATGSAAMNQAGSVFSRMLDSMHPREAVSPLTMPAAPVTHDLKPYAAADLIGPGGHHVRPEVALRAYTRADVVNRTGQRVAATQPTTQPLKPTDFMPGVRGKAHGEHLNPLAASDSVPHTKIATKNDADLEVQARKWVSQTFFGTLLKQMHDSPFKSDLFSGGRGGKAFEPLMDQHLADHMARGSGKKLVMSIVRQLKNRAKVKEQPGDQKTDVNNSKVPSVTGALSAGESSAFNKVRIDVAPSTGN